MAAEQPQGRSVGWAVARLWDLEATAMSSGKPPAGMTQFHLTFCRDGLGSRGQNVLQRQVWQQESRLGAVQSLGPEVTEARMRQG